MTLARSADAPTFDPAMNLVRAARDQVAGGHTVSPRKKHLALAIAGIADIVQIAIFPLFAEGAISPYEDALDAVIAIVLFLVLGKSWRLALAFALELVPGLDLFPTWTAVVLSIPTQQALPAQDTAPALPPGGGTK